MYIRCIASIAFVVGEVLLSPSFGFLDIETPVAVGFMLFCHNN